MSQTPQRARRWKLALGLIAAAMLALVLLVTSGQPWVAESRHASAEQVAAARALANEARKSR
ncbi:MAG: transcriptional regulator, partial [Pseudomonadota bacterium]|nr:transcriptional regulator [Pseudomonadota bacterium]